MGIPTTFLVACDESADFVKGLGLDCRIVEGDSLNRGPADIARISQWCLDHEAMLLVDTYALGWDDFRHFPKTLHEQCGVAYIDDYYTFKDGLHTHPVRLPVDVVIKYSYYARPEIYEQVYGDATGSRPTMLIGPRYALLRPSFAREVQSLCEGKPHEFQEDRRVLITSGATNPRRFLERMTNVVLKAATRDFCIDVVVGAKSEFDKSTLALDELYDGRLTIHRGLTSLAPLMAHATLAVSSGGTTLYELAYAGLPSVVTPLVENQRLNCRAYAQRGLGVAIDGSMGEGDAIDIVSELLVDGGLLRDMAARGRETVDGKGSSRVAEALRCVGAR